MTTNLSGSKVMPPIPKTVFTAYKLLRRWARRVVNIGVTTELSFDEMRHTRISNIIGITGFTASTFFFFNNLTHQRDLLAVLNLVTVLMMGGLLYANIKRRYYSGQLIVSIVLTLVFAASGLLYHTGMEFYLLIIAALSITVQKKRAILLVVCVVDCLLFLFLVIWGHRFNFFDPIPQSVYFSNIAIWLVFYILFFWYFKSQNKGYQQEIENRNQKLQEQQSTLLHQTQQLGISNKQLQVLNSTKEKLFSIVAHDVRSPIAGLRATLDLFSQNILTKEDLLELSGELSLQLNHIHNSLENLLRWSNSQMSGIEIQKQNILLEPLIAETIGLLQHNLINKNIQANIITEGNNVIDADPNHIKLILRNLVSNAIKFSYAGSQIDLVINKTKDAINLSVVDNGIGIKEEALQDIFSPTAIFSTRGTSNEKGTGMGLKLSKEFAEKNGISLTVENKPESAGCIFKLAIPAAPVA